MMRRRPVCCRWARGESEGGGRGRRGLRRWSRRRRPAQRSGRRRGQQQEQRWRRAVAWQAATALQSDAVRPTVVRARAGWARTAARYQHCTCSPLAQRPGSRCSKAVVRRAGQGLCTHGPNAPPTPPQSHGHRASRIEQPACVRKSMFQCRNDDERSADWAARDKQNETALLMHAAGSLANYTAAAQRHQSTILAYAFQTG